MRAATGENTFAPFRLEVWIDPQHLPPATKGTGSVRLDHQTPRNQFAQWMIRPVPVHNDHLFKTVIGQTFTNVEHILDEMFKVNVDRARKIHHMVYIAITD